MRKSSQEETRGRRGQMVLVAAIFIAIALVPIVFAYLQLGYDADVEAGADTIDSMTNAERLLERAVNEAGTNAPATDGWNQSGGVVTEVRDHLRPYTNALEQSRITEGVVYHVSYNNSTAGVWATANCPTGPARQFGPCKADSGVVVQERIGETHVIAVAFDVQITTGQRRIEATMLVPVV